MTALTKYEYICHPLFLITAGGFNFPPLVFGVLGFVEWCNYYSNWLVGNAALTGLNIIAAIYCVYKIRKVARPRQSSSRTDEAEEDAEKGDSDTDSNSNNHHRGMDEVTITDPSPPPPAARAKSGCFSRLIHMRTTSSDRIRHLVCYDGIITTYAILFLFWVFWLSEGTQRVLQMADVEEEEQFEGCMVYHERYMKTSLVCGFVYVGFVVVAGLASLC